jgi:hypothetical protein
MTTIDNNFFSQEDFNKVFQNQILDMEEKEKERLKLNEFCKDSSIPSCVKAEAQIDFAIKWSKK